MDRRKAIRSRGARARAASLAAALWLAGPARPFELLRGTDVEEAASPRAPQATLVLPGAVAGRPFRAELPAFSVPGGGRLALSAEGLPEGLRFLDHGDGSGELGGTSARPGAQTFAIIATNPGGLTALMTVVLPVAEPVRPPEPSQPSVTLAEAAAGRDYRAALPPFRAGDDPSGLKLSVAPAPPDGLAFFDAGGGAGLLSGRPKLPGAYSFDVVSADSFGPGGRMTVNLAVAAEPAAAAPPAQAPPSTPAARPPQPALASVALTDAIAGRDYNALLPPFRPGADPRSLTLRVEPAPPEGMTFTDAGGGFSVLAGRAARAGVYMFEVVSSDANGPGGRMSVKLTVAPAEASPPQSADEAKRRRRDFFKTYDGGACFFAAPTDAASAPNAVEAVGADAHAFERFEAAFQRELGDEPNITARLISPAQCPLVDLLRRTANSDAKPASLVLDAVRLRQGRPLSGRVFGLAGRVAQLALFDVDGGVASIRAVSDRGGNAATFQFALRAAEPDPIGRARALVVITSSAPLAAFAGPLPPTAAGLVGALGTDWDSAGAAAAAAYFWVAR